MILLPLFLVPIVFCMALVRLYCIPTRLLRGELRAVSGRVALNFFLKTDAWF
mgnify:CR=1 FL=1